MTGRQRIASALGGATLLAMAAILLAASMAPTWVKAGLISAVQEKTGRTLEIEGEPALGLWPRITLGLGRTSLSEKDSRQVFARIEGARLSLAPLPLFAGHVVADAVEVSGLEATVIRHADGSLNIGDLFARQEGGPLQIDIAAVKLTDGRFTWRDEQTGRVAALSDILVETGPVHADTGNHVFSISTAALAGRVADSTAKLELVGVEADADRLAIARLGLDFDAKAGDAAVTCRLDSSLTVDFAKGSARLPKIASTLSVSHPSLPMKKISLPVTGSASVDLTKPAADMILAAELDGSRINGRLAIERLSPLALGVDLEIDRLDLDRYQAPGPAQKGAPVFAPPTGIDLHGTVRIGSLRLAGLQAANVRLQLGNQAGSPMSAR